MIEIITAVIVLAALTVAFIVIVKDAKGEFVQTIKKWPLGSKIMAIPTILIFAFVAWFGLGLVLTGVTKCAADTPPSELDIAQQERIQELEEEGE
jgi:amino acid permease